MILNIVEKQIIKNRKKLENNPIHDFGFKYNTNFQHWWNSLEYEDYERNVLFKNTKVDPNKAAEDYALIGWGY